MISVDVSYLTTVFDIESEELDRRVREHPSLGPFFSLDFSGRSLDGLRTAYVRLLKLKADYVRHSVPMLRASGEALRGGDAEDRAWSELFLGYAQDETDEDGKERYGHHVWAMNDMKALGAPPDVLEAAAHPCVDVYGRYFVENAALHPYAILGAKGVLEHLSIRMSDDLVKGVLASGMDNAAEAVSFFHHHGALDIDHVRAGDRNLERLQNPDKRAQVLEGAYFTGGAYRTFLRFCV